MMSLPKSEKGASWRLILRIKAGDAAVVVEDLKKKGFRVTDVT